MQVRLLHKCIRVQFWGVFECGFVMQEKSPTIRLGHLLDLWAYGKIVEIDKRPIDQSPRT